MADQIVVQEGHRPWCPSSWATMGEVLNGYDRPLLGLIQQDGHSYLYWCLIGETSDVNVWAYSLLEDQDVRALDQAEDPDEVAARVIEACGRGPITVALASHGQILLSASVEPQHDDPDLLIVDAVQAISRVIDAGTRAANGLGLSVGVGGDSGSRPAVGRAGSTVAVVDEPAPAEVAPPVTEAAPEPVPTPVDGPSPDIASPAQPEVSTERPLYVHQGDGAVDATLWPAARVKTTDGGTLYTFIGDAFGGPATGASGDWAVYDGETIPA